MTSYTGLYYLELDIDVENAFNKQLDLERFRKTGYNLDGRIDMWHITRKNLLNIFDQAWLDYMASLAIDVEEAIIFYREPNYFHKNLHIDISPSSQIMSNGLNFVFDHHDDSEMLWYELENNDEDYIMSTIKYTEHDLPYASWEVDEFPGSLADRKTIGRKMTLVKTCVPHTVVTYTLPRWSFSLRTQELSNWSWEEAIDKLSKFT